MKLGHHSKLGGIRGVAIFEAAKGLLVLIASGVLLPWLHANAQTAAEDVVRHLHMNPARHYPRVFAETLLHLGNGHLVALSIGALSYAAVRFVEAYGLWRERAWAWGFGICSAGLYLPVELVELADHRSWTALGVFILNVAVIIVLWLSRSEVRTPA